MPDGCYPTVERGSVLSPNRVLDPRYLKYFLEHVAVQLTTLKFGDNIQLYELDNGCVGERGKRGAESAGQPLNVFSVTGRMDKPMQVVIGMQTGGPHGLVFWNGGGVKYKYPYVNIIMQPRVEVLIPTYNHESFVERAVESVLNQTYENLKIIVSDDNSKDNTVKRVKSFDSKKVKINKNKKNKGMVKNYEYLLYELSDSRWVMMLDGDDYLCRKKYLEEAVEVIKKEKSVVCVFADEIVKHKDFEKRRKYSINGLVSGKKAIERFCEGERCIVHTTSVYNAEIAKNIGFYERPISSTDYESLLKLYSEGDVYHIDKPSAVHNIHRHSKSQKVQSVISSLRNLTYIDRAAEYWSKNNKKIPNLDKKRSRVKEKRIKRYIESYNLEGSYESSIMMLCHVFRNKMSIINVIGIRVIISFSPGLYKIFEDMYRALNSVFKNQNIIEK